jgi:hypothetical protein
VFTLEGDGAAFVAELMAAVDGLMKIPFTVPSNYDLAIESIALWYRRYLGINSFEETLDSLCRHQSDNLIDTEADEP